MTAETSGGRAVPEGVGEELDAGAVVAEGFDPGAVVDEGLDPKLIVAVACATAVGGAVGEALDPSLEPQARTDSIAMTTTTRTAALRCRCDKGHLISTNPTVQRPEPRGAVLGIGAIICAASVMGV